MLRRGRDKLSYSLVFLICHPSTSPGAQKSDRKRIDRQTRLVSGPQNLVCGDPRNYLDSGNRISGDWGFGLPPSFFEISVLGNSREGDNGRSDPILGRSAK